MLKIINKYSVSLTFKLVHKRIVFYVFLVRKVLRTGVDLIVEKNLVELNFVIELDFRR